MPKNLQYLSKRRRNQLINRNLNHYKHSDLVKLISNESNITSNNVEASTSRNVEIFNINSTNSALSEDALLNDLSVQSEVCSTKSICSTESVCSTENNNITSENSSASANVFHSNNENSLWKDLQTLIVERNIAHNTANELLSILKKHGHVELPCDVRILVRTPRNISSHIEALANGHYMHFGLSSSLEHSIKMYSKFIKKNDIKLNVNIDGLPISKSSGSQFWPILVSIEDINVYTSPIIIGVYHGIHKPNNANEFLTPFVNDFILFLQNGITVSNVKYNVSIKAILCDAPARAFITYTKSHTGYFSCPKCIQEGDFVSNRVIFTETNNALRTDDTFKNRSQIEHHTGDSVLEKLSIGMVSQIPLDYMHLVCLGVMKRLLQLWLKGSINIRLSKESIESVSQYLIAIKSYIPSEFARKPRSLHDVDKWKATEFRQFLLYTGIVIMKSILPSVYYNHFLCLSIAMRILTDSELCVTFNDYANSLLLWFVSNYKNIYGDKYLSYNVHNLIHLANDALTFGSLDNISCFKYENYMQKIKKKLHQCGKPLEELSNRIFEELYLPIQPINIVQYPFVVYKKNNKISYLQFETFKIATNKSDNCALLDSMSVVFILDIFHENNALLIRAQRFLRPKSLFTTPFISEKLGIYVISNTSASDIITIPVTQIKKKCLKIKYYSEIDSYVTIPLQHMNN